LQVVINRDVNERINNLTKITNEISNFIRKDSKYVDELALIIQNRLRLVKEEILNIKYAIQWAKNGVINTVLFNKNEIQKATETIVNDRLPFETIEEALECANVKILANKTTLFYVTVIPLTTKENYHELLIKPKKRKLCNIY